MISHLLLVALGGAAGSVLRYGLSLLLNAAWPALGHYPLGTLTANVIGCFLLGLVLGWQARLSEGQVLLLATGLCGGLTTFSTLEAEAWAMGRLNLARAALYLALSLSLGLGAFVGGLSLARR